MSLFGSIFFELLLLAIPRKILKENFHIVLFLIGLSNFYKTIICFREIVVGSLINGRELKILFVYALHGLSTSSPECVADEGLIGPLRVNKNQGSDRELGTKYIGQFMIFMTSI